MKKKGFTLIEVIVYISIGTVLITLMIGVIFNLVKFRKDYIKRSIEEDMVTNGIISISSRLNKGQLKNIEVENNKTIAINENGNKTSKITLYNGADLAVCYYEGNRLLTVNKIITGISDFEVVKKQKLVYIKISIEENVYEEVFKI
ncbi:type II secretion system protein [Clostridium sp. UBA1652]|uniref:type II secretion system protein n=1 Tax=Clostridium sp. UBA1652 TaxID=1946348 RepID=UPI00257C7CF1|nr:prepilin-type N-terminal cleavage/methylation domain-containing protein [Clostridium sp. UBA1652]